ncbi:hypothetical protein ACK9YZ_31405 [Rhizobium sp. ZK1]|uniref:hypothetical protein n=1 Tax=Rhizobium sp. ZK1 TaxID=3389872 RepID=UPI0039F6EAAE
MPRITKTEARKYIALILATKSDGKFVSYAWGDLVNKNPKTGKPEQTGIFVVSKRNGAGVKGKAGRLNFADGDKLELKGVGACRLEGNVLLIAGFNGQNPKGPPARIAKRVKSFFERLAIKSWGFTRIVETDDVTIDESEFLDTFADEPDISVNDEELDRALEAIAAEYGEGLEVEEEYDQETTLSERPASAQTQPGSEEESDGETAVEDAGSNYESDSEDETEIGGLDPAMDANITQKLGGIVSTLLNVAQSIGLPMSGKHADIVAKLFSWLERILLALPPEKRQAAADNWLARLQLAINSSTQSMRDASMVAPKQKDPAAGKQDAGKEARSETDEEAKSDEGGSDDIIAGVTLEDITTDEPSEDEVVGVVFDKGVAALHALNEARRQANLPDYNVSAATKDKLHQMVKGALARGNSAADAIARLFATLDKAFQDPDILLRYFDVPIVGPEQAAAAAPGLDQSHIAQLLAGWQAAHAKAYAMVEDLKLEVANRLRANSPDGKLWTVENLGGSWDRVDAIFKFVEEEEISRELSAVASASEKDGATAVLQDTVERYIGFLTGHAIVEAIDNNPFATGQSVGPTLLSNLNLIRQQLKQQAQNAA